MTLVDLALELTASVVAGVVAAFARRKRIWDEPGATDGMKPGTVVTSVGQQDVNRG